MGNHWSLLIADKNSYYGDSLSWPLLKSSVKTSLDLLSADLNININECFENLSI